MLFTRCRSWIQDREPVKVDEQTVQARPQDPFLPVSLAPQGRLGENPTNEIANRSPANMAIKKQKKKKKKIGQV